ncbi:MAG: hypothetical protein LWX83_05915 [Anaerolineae bacterium]|nr:hypothetical protein [Anaerolineae bacterium]
MRTRRISARAGLSLARLLIGLVLFFNLQCAFLFLSAPEVYMSAYEMSGAVGMAMLRALGLLFLMWNVPYFLAVYHPLKYRISLYEATLMQVIGFLGEWLLVYANLPDGHAVLRESVQRFMVFDGAGLLLLLLALGLLKSLKSESSG